MRSFNKIITCAFAVIFVALTGCGHKEAAPKPAALVAFNPALEVKTLWSKNIDAGSGKEELKLSPAGTADKIFVADYKGKVSAVNRDSGKTIWSANTEAPITTGLAVGDGLVFVGTGQGKIFALYQSNGKKKWQNAMTNEILATPLYAQNVVVAKTENGQLSGFDALSGKRLWNYMQEGPALVLRGSSAPKVYDGMVVSGFANGELVALDIDSGNVVWKQIVAEPKGSFAVERMIDINADPVIIDNRIYVATFQGKLAALNVKNGNILWEQNISTYSGLTVDTHNVYISDSSDTVWAFDRDDGSVRWKQNALANRQITAPVAIGSYVVVGDAEGYLHWLAKANGNFVARDKIGSGGILDAPIASGNSIYVFTRGGKLAKLAI